MSFDKKAYMKAYREAHKKEIKAYRESHKEENNAYCKAYRESHKDYFKAYKKADVNSLGKSKHYIRNQSRYYLQKHGTKIHGYQIHHCFTYDDPHKFIYCPIKLHNEIHKFLNEKGIDADTDHYEQIKHLLDDTVILYGIE